MFEEPRLKRTVKELDENKQTKPSYFNSIQNTTVDGLIKYQYDTEIKFAYVVYVKRGSKVGVPNGFMAEQIFVENKFLQGISKRYWSYERHEINKKSEISDVVKHASNRLLTVNDDVLTMFHRMQVEALQVWSTGETNEIVDYYVIYNTKVPSLVSFRDNLEELIGDTFGNSNFFSASILNQQEVEAFFKDLLMLETFDMKNVKRSVSSVNLSDFAEITREFDEFGNELLDLDFGEKKKRATGNQEDIFEAQEAKDAKERERVKRKEKQFYARQTRELNKFERQLISKDELHEQEYLIFDSLFKEEDLDHLSEDMDKYYNNWRIHIEGDEISEDDDILDLEEEHIEDEFEVEEVIDFVDDEELEFDDEEDDDEEIEFEQEVEVPFGVRRKKEDE